MARFSAAPRSGFSFAHFGDTATPTLSVMGPQGNETMGIDAAGGDAYVRAVTSTSQTAQRDARAFLAECQRVVAAKCPGLAKRPCAKS